MKHEPREVLCIIIIIPIIMIMIIVTLGYSLCSHRCDPDLLQGGGNLPDIDLVVDHVPAVASAAHGLPFICYHTKRWSRSERILARIGMSPIEREGSKKRPIKMMRTVK